MGREKSAHMQTPCVLFHDAIFSDDVYLEPKKEYLICCAIDKTQHNTNTYMFTPYMEKNEKKNIVAATSIVTPNEGVIPVRVMNCDKVGLKLYKNCLLYTSPSPRDRQKSRMPSSA